MAGHSRRAAIGFVLLGLFIFATIVTLSVVMSGGNEETSQLPAEHQHRRPEPILRGSPAAPPPVEPLEFTDMSPDEARTYNAKVPFVPGKLLPAPPFRYAGTPEDRVRARACLAAAVLYEAGDDAKGEEAVAQVVLNRLRHPAFPKTVCGVVFQGAERKTGCQFTFTCDGALARSPGRAAWVRAKEIADRALSGHVDGAVGTATHYHADYVVPYWGSSLAKIARVGPHIFYRWPGRWGLPVTLTGRTVPFERIDSRVAAFDGLGPVAIAGLDPDEPEVVRPTVPLQNLAIAGVPERALKGAIVRLKDEEASQFILQLDPGGFAGGFAVIGYTICSGRPNCIVMGWTSAADVPRTFPVLPMALRRLAFLYRRSSITDTAQPFWDCRRFPRPVASQCLPGTRD